MKELFKSALDRIEADEDLVSQTELRLRCEFSQIQHSRTKYTKGRIYTMKKFALVACMVLLLIGGGFAYATPTSYLSVDINPSVELGINPLGYVVSVEALNEDGVDILSGIDVTGMKVKEAVKSIVDAAADKGYLNGDGSSIVSLTAATDDEEKATRLTEAAEEGTEAALAENETSAEVNQVAISAARRDAAIEAGISPGKMNLIQKLWEATENDGVAATEDDFDKILEYANEQLGESDVTCADSSVKDIMKAIKAARVDSESNPANVNNTEEINVDGNGKGKTNAPGQELKAETKNNNNQNSTLPNEKAKKNGTGNTLNEEQE